MSVLPQIAPDCADGKIVIAHLGNGASMCAVEHGRSVATTMSFTPLDGLMMGTRTGALDPGVILYLLQHEAYGPGRDRHLLYHRSGLLGVSGISSDMRKLLASEQPSAKEAVDLFVYRIGRELGSLVAALGGLDALGLHRRHRGASAPEIRARVCRDAAWTGIMLDSEANEPAGLYLVPRIAGRHFVIPTDENR